MSGSRCMNKRALASVALAWTLCGCVSLEPRYKQPALPVADSWPIAASTAAASNPAASNADSHVTVADIGWRDFFLDERLQQLIALSLANNRDLRVAIAN